MRPTAFGHPHYLGVLELLKDLHREKSSSYGTMDDPLDNYRKVAAFTGREPEEYALERIVEKATRALNMIRDGDALEVREYLDMAGLAICADCLRAERGTRPDGPG